MSNTRTSGIPKVLYHRGEGGQWRKCKAFMRGCPFGGDHLTPQQYEAFHTPTRVSLEKAPSREPQPIQKISRVNGEAKEGRVAPKGFSGVSCPKCDRYQPLNMRHQDSMLICAYCGYYGSLPSFHMDVRGDEAKYLDDSEVRAGHWFHITSRPNWAEDVKNGGGRPEPGGIMVHLGSREAAMDRLRDMMRSPTNAAETYYLHEVRLKPDTNISPNLFSDDDRWPRNGESVEKYPEFSGFSADGVTRYVNTYEGPSTISLVAQADCFESVARVEIPGFRN